LSPNDQVTTISTTIIILEVADRRRQWTSGFEADLSTSTFMPVIAALVGIENPKLFEFALILF
jgi:hypothetical protein